jgi:tetratricopeptide (TPR) repeat protein
MKRFILIVLAAALFVGCASKGRNQEPDEPGVSLIEAVGQFVERLIVALPARSRLVIVSFESEVGVLSGFVVEELTGALVDRGFDIADRQNLDYVFRELNLQRSANISETTAQAVGRYLGAQFAIIGQLVSFQEAYRFRISAIHVDGLTQEVVRFTIPSDLLMQPSVIPTVIPFFDEITFEQTAIQTVLLAEQINIARNARNWVGEQALLATAGSFLDRGISFVSQGNYEMAISEFTEAIRLNPGLNTVYIMRGRALFSHASEIIVKENLSSIVDEDHTAEHLQIFDQLIGDFTMALRIDPHNAVIYRDRGRVYFARKDLDRALADFDQAIRMDRNFPEAHNNRGIVFYKRRVFDRAVSDFTQAIQMNPVFADAYFNRGRIFFETNDYDRAIADFEVVLLINSGDVNARTLLENARQQRGR